ncbi:Transmembrane protein, putative [Perkinsus marinus ATCC 50983]|uniref:Transmembrane protein, putative n=1 Tax=Perkinsus marinus (strain ATCC 50983 / TXsc) TaxID=423536 RepID=C5LVP4_PERM5|nr:Transmembrane protein, putative [Perkinsus marinus ATCC 50983]EEQ99167.1 Transmembrane protein, putative [Perkinsus marinus ATCC 50983]|eukprot:XP_002766450.1 Transmembrane protein, putative [Perkinsus marinus ATCC 50983]
MSVTKLDIISSEESTAESIATLSDTDPEDPVQANLKGTLPSTSPILGGFLCMIGVFFFSLMQLCAYMASAEFSGSEITLVRSVIQTIIAAFFALLVQVNPIGPPGCRLICFIRGLVGALANLLLLYAVARMPMANANAIFFTNPVFTAVYSALILKQRVSFVGVVALFVGLTGSVFVVRPSFVFDSSITVEESQTDLSALIVTIAGAATSGMVPIIVYFIGSSVHYVCLVFSFGVCGTFESAASLALGLDALTLPSVASTGYSRSIFMIGTGIFGTLSQFFYNRSLQLEKPQNCAILFQANVAFTFLWQALTKPDEISLLSVVGSLMIVCSSLAILGAKIASSSGTSEPNHDLPAKSLKVSVSARVSKE